MRNFYVSILFVSYAQFPSLYAKCTYGSLILKTQKVHTISVTNIQFRMMLVYRSDKKSLDFQNVASAHKQTMQADMDCLIERDTTPARYFLGVSPIL